MPTISTRTGNMMAFIRANDNGWLVDTEEALATHLGGLELNGELGILLRERTLATARNRSWKYMILNYLWFIDPAREGSGPWLKNDRPPVAMIALMRSTGVDSECLESVSARLALPSKDFTWKLAPAPPLATVAWARSKLLTDCVVQTDGEVFLMWDGDMAVAPHSATYLCKLALEEDAIVSTIVSKRALRHGWINKLQVDRYPVVLGSDGVLQLGEGEYTGAALTAYPRSVLERLARHLPFVQPHGCTRQTPRTGFWPFFIDALVEEEDGVKWLTEDRSFCDFARKMGERVLVALAPTVRHLGKYGFTPSDGAMFTKELDDDGRSEEEAGGGAQGGGDAAEASGDGGPCAG